MEFIHSYLTLYCHLDTIYKLSTLFIIYHEGLGKMIITFPWFGISVIVAWQSIVKIIRASFLPLNRFDKDKPVYKIIEKADESKINGITHLLAIIGVNFIILIPCFIVIYILILIFTRVYINYRFKDENIDYIL